MWSYGLCLIFVVRMNSEGLVSYCAAKMSNITFDNSLNNISSST